MRLFEFLPGKWLLTLAAHAPAGLARHLYVEHHNRRHLSVRGRVPDVQQPTRFSERVLARMLTLRHPEVARLADKIGVRDHVAAVLGDRFLVPLLGVWNSPDAIPWDDLPDRFVIKCSHGSAMNVVVTDKRGLDRAATSRRLRKWLATDFSTMHGELLYRDIPARILAERFLDDHSGTTPADYKVHVFFGRARFVQLCIGRGKDLRNNFYDRSLALLPIAAHPDDNATLPEGTSALLGLAERLAGNFSYVRVDFYVIDGQPYVGEMTFSPGAGLLSSLTNDGDVALGRAWAEEQARAATEPSKQHWL